MTRFLLRIPSFLAPAFHQSPVNFRNSKTHLSVVPPLGRDFSRFVFFSSESDSAHESKSDEVVTKEELKNKIKSFLDDGDENALPELFTAIMKRKLSGKHDDSDNEVMNEVRKDPVNDAFKINDNDSDIDIDSDHLNEDDFSDSDIEINSLKLDHLSNSDSESD